MPRYFKLAEAESLLPDVERPLRDALFQKAEYERADQELDRAAGHANSLHHARTAGHEALMGPLYRSPSSHRASSTNPVSTNKATPR